MTRAGGLVLLLLLAALTVQKLGQGLVAEMLWICHVTSALLAVGLLARLPLLIASGLLCNLAIATPSYVLYVATGGATSITSFMLHLLSPLFGWLAWRGRPMPPAAPWLALAIYPVLVVLCRLFTPEALNVNLAFRPWEGIMSIGAWHARALNVVLMLAQLYAVYLLWNRFGAQPTSTPPAASSGHPPA